VRREEGFPAAGIPRAALQALEELDTLIQDHLDACAAAGWREPGRVASRLESGERARAGGLRLLP
jgi:hypothetical protein